MPPPDPDTYPPISRFHAGISEAELRGAIRLSNDDPIPRRLSLALRLPGGDPEFESDMARLHREIDLVARLLDRDREVVELRVDSACVRGHFPMEAVRDVSDALWHQFHFSAAVTSEYSISVDPLTVSTGQIAGLASEGFNRVVFEAEPLEPAVFRAARDIGFKSISIVASDPSEAIACAERLRPDRLSIRQHAEPARGHTTRAVELDQRMDQAGYLYIGPDQFALPNDDLALAFKGLRLRCGPFGFTAHTDCDSIGFGTGAISQVGGCYSQNAESPEIWRRDLDSGRLPARRGLLLSEDDELRGEIIQQLYCRRQIEVRGLERRYAVAFRSYFAADLARLAPCLRLGLVRDFGDRIAVCSRGWPWLRNIAQCFDSAAHDIIWPKEAGQRH